MINASFCNTNADDFDGKAEFYEEKANDNIQTALRALESGNYAGAIQYLGSAISMINYANADKEKAVMFRAVARKLNED